MQGLFYGAFQGKKKDLLPLLSKLGEKRGDRDHMMGFIFRYLHLPDNWAELGDEDWVKARFASGGSMNINYLEGPLFSELSAYLLPVEGLTMTQTLDYGVKRYTYSPYGSLEILNFDRKDQVRSAARPFERETGQSSVVQDQQSWSDYESANAQDLIPDEVLPPPCCTDSPFLIQKGVLVKYLGHEETVTVPEGCTAIGPRSFQHCKELKRVTIPKTVETIGEEAFSCCSALEEVELAQGLKTLEGGVFWGTKLRRVELPEGLNCIKLCFPDGVFLKIPASLTKMDDYTIQHLAGAEVAKGNSAYFSQNGALYAKTKTGAVLLRVPQTVQGVFEIQDGVQAIGEKAFWCCRELTGVRFPAGLTQIGRDAFGGCGALESVELPEGLVTIEGSAFSGSSLRAVRFPSTLQTIEYFAFQTVIGRGAATALKRVELPENTTCSQSSFDEDTVIAADLASEAARQRLLLPAQAVELSLTPGRDYTGMVTPAVLAYFVDRDAVEAFTQLEPFVPELWELLPDLLRHARLRGAQKVEQRLLELEQLGQEQGKKRKPPTAAQLKKLWWVRDNPDGTCTILDYRGPFLHPVLPAAVGKRAVKQWSRSFDTPRTPSTLDQIITLTLPATLTKFEDTLGKASRLERIEVEAGNPAYRSQDGVLLNAAGTALLLYPLGRREARYEIPERVRSIKPDSFRGNCFLQEVIFPKGLKKVEKFSFEGCRGLTSIVFPEGVKTFGAHAFSSCHGLTRIVLPDGVEIIGAYAFSSYGLRDVVLPGSVKNLDKSAFGNIPSGLTIHAPAGSYAEAFAQENNIPFQPL